MNDLGLPEAGPVTRFSTDAVAPAARAAYWREAICETFVRLEFDCDRTRPFQANLACRPLSRFACIAVDASAQRVRRSAALVAEDREATLIIMLQRRGECVAVQDGTEVRLRSGGVALVDSRRPYALAFPDAFSQTVIRVPAATLEQRCGRAATAGARLVPTESSLGRLAVQALDELGREPRAAVALPLSAVAFDLLALALGETAPADGPPPRMATMRLSWAKAQVLAELRDPALRPQANAERQGVSLRLLQRLFSEQGECVADFILEQRLQRCSEALQEPSNAARTITEIALSWGFGDSAVFARAFRRRFGVAPREWRRQVRREPDRGSRSN